MNKYDIALKRQDKPKTTVHTQVEADSLWSALRAAASAIVEIRASTPEDEQPMFYRAIVELVDE